MREQAAAVAAGSAGKRRRPRADRRSEAWKHGPRMSVLSTIPCGAERRGRCPPDVMGRAQMLRLGMWLAVWVADPRRRLVGRNDTVANVHHAMRKLGDIRFVRHHHN